MAQIEVVSWRADAVGFSAWDVIARSELKKRLRRAVPGSPAALRSLAKRIHAHDLVMISDVRDEALASLRQILETLGADVVVPNPAFKPTQRSGAA